MAKINLGKVSITLGGSWANNVSYAPLTAVISDDDGCGYISRKLNINVKPGSDEKVWKKIVERGKSIYDLAVKYGYEGTEQEFVNDYNLAIDKANLAATRAQTAASDAQSAIDDIQTLNAAIIVAEDNRQAAENLRVETDAQRNNIITQIEQQELARVDAEGRRRIVFDTSISETKTASDVANQSAKSASEAANSCKVLTDMIANDWYPAQQEAITIQINLAKQATDNANEAAQTVDTKTADIPAIKRLLGYNHSSNVVILEPGIAGKYIQCASRSAVDNSAFAISKPFAVDACSELLIKTGYNPSDNNHKALDLSVIAIYEEIERQRTVQKKDGSGNLLYYAVTIDDETGSVTVITDETTENTGYPVYVLETYIETRYLPNNEDRFVSIPDSGYYVANIPQSCKVVISYKPGITDMEVIIEKHGALANLISQVFGIYEHRTMVEAMVSLAARVDALEKSKYHIGNVAAGTIDVTEITKYRYPLTMLGHGVPSADVIPVNLPNGLPWDGVPMYRGQMYINMDASSSGLYYAVGTGSINDWKQA